MSLMCGIRPQLPAQLSALSSDFVQSAACIHLVQPRPRVSLRDTESQSKLYYIRPQEEDYTFSDELLDKWSRLADGALERDFAAKLVDQATVSAR